MTSRPKILLPPDVEAWFAEAMRKCDEACAISKQRVIETAKRKEAEHGTTSD